VDLWADTNISGKDIVPIFRADLKIQAVCSSEILVSTYKSTQFYNPED
jgi:hypothetical protein